MELELEARRDPEIRAGATQPPEQLGFLFRARTNGLAVGGHELDRAQAVDREAEPPLQPADAATERQPGDAGVPDDAHRADEPVLLGSDVELTEQGPTTRPCSAPLSVDDDLVHLAEVDDETAVGGRMPDGAVATSADGDLEVAVATEADGGRDVLDARRPKDQCRTSIERRVPDPPGIVVGGGIWRDDFAGEGAPKLVDVGGRGRGGFRSGHGISLGARLRATRQRRARYRRDRGSSRAERHSDRPRPARGRSPGRSGPREGRRALSPRW